MADDLEDARIALDSFRRADAVGQARVAERRAAWPSARATIERAMREVADSTPRFVRGLVVTTSETKDNFGAVQIGFGPIPTGVSVNYPRGGGAVGVEYGAVLLLGQAESGLIAVLRYPFRTCLPDGPRPAPEPQFLEFVEPEAIDRSRVLRLMADFFNWVGSTSIMRTNTSAKPRIGFVPSPKEMDEGK